LLTACEEPGDRRSRICALAEQHVGYGPHDDPQVALFSLGGLYDYDSADTGTSPNGTTCMLVARSIYHAAGCNVITKRCSRRLCAVPGGMGEWHPEFASAFVRFKGAWDRGLRPQRGDIFHIEGGKYDSQYGEQISSAHVGILIAAAENTWTVVQGGSSDHRTEKKIRTLFDKGGGAMAFTDDTEMKDPTAHYRPLRGWWDVSNIPEERWMEGT
jgi:hypothetical protein